MDQYPSDSPFFQPLHRPRPTPSATSETTVSGSGVVSRSNLLALDNDTDYVVQSTPIPGVGLVKAHVAEAERLVHGMTSETRAATLKRKAEKEKEYGRRGLCCTDDYKPLYEFDLDWPCNQLFLTQDMHTAYNTIASVLITPPLEHLENDIDVLREDTRLWVQELGTKPTAKRKIRFERLQMFREPRAEVTALRVPAPGTNRDHTPLANYTRVFRYSGNPPSRNAVSTALVDGRWTSVDPNISNVNPFYPPPTSRKPSQIVNAHLQITQATARYRQQQALPGGGPPSDPRGRQLIKALEEYHDLLWLSPPGWLKAIKAEERDQERAKEKARKQQEQQRKQAEERARAQRVKDLQGSLSEHTRGAQGSSSNKNSGSKGGRKGGKSRAAQVDGSVSWALSTPGDSCSLFSPLLAKRPPLEIVYPPAYASVEIELDDAERADLAGQQQQRWKAEQEERSLYADRKV